MITHKAGITIIDIQADDLYRAIALLKDMKDFCQEQTEDGVLETAKALTVAIETMTAFWAEHFAEDE